MRLVLSRRHWMFASKRCGFCSSALVFVLAYHIVFIVYIRSHCFRDIGSLMPSSFNARVWYLSPTFRQVQERLRCGICNLPSPGRRLLSNCMKKLTVCFWVQRSTFFVFPTRRLRDAKVANKFFFLHGIIYNAARGEYLCLKSVSNVC